jgi:hypothetical protein
MVALAATAWLNRAGPVIDESMTQAEMKSRKLPLK